MATTLSADFKFFYPVKIEEQLSFEGKVFKTLVYGHGHIIRGESLLCGTERKTLVGEGKKNFKILTKKREGKMCAECLEKWKADANSPYQRWTKGEAVKARPLPALSPSLTSELVIEQADETPQKTEEWRDEWVDMPEFVQEKQKPFSTLIVRMETQDDLDEFSKLIGQKLTNKTKSIWHPFKSHWGGEGSNKRYVDES